MTFQAGEKAFVPVWGPDNAWRVAPVTVIAVEAEGIAVMSAEYMRRDHAQPYEVFRTPEEAERACALFALQDPWTLR